MLYDVTVLLGLPINGPVVTGRMIMIGWLSVQDY